MLVWMSTVVVVEGKGLLRALELLLLGLLLHTLHGVDRLYPFSFLHTTYAYYFHRLQARMLVFGRL